MNCGKNYTVGQFVGRSKSDQAAVAEILKANPLWKPKHARDLLARRRFIAASSNGKTAGAHSALKLTCANDGSIPSAATPLKEAA